MRSSQLKSTAYHEAGHAVAAWWLNIGLRRKGVTIVPDRAEGILGSSTSRQTIGRGIEWATSDKNRIRVERRVQMMLAGEVAQRRFAPGSVRHYHAESDRIKAIDALSYFAADQRELEAWLKLLYIRTENMFANPNIWRATEVLATALMQRQTIGGKEAKEIIYEAVNQSAHS
jgi:hypothetical protein